MYKARNMVDYSHWTQLPDSDDEEQQPRRAEASQFARLEKQVEDFQQRRLAFVMRRQSNEACRLRYNLKLAKRQGSSSHWHRRLRDLESQLPQLEAEDEAFADELRVLMNDPALKGPSRVGFAKSMINKRAQPAPPFPDPPCPMSTLGQLEQRMQRFVAQHGELADEFAQLRCYESSMSFLLRHVELISSDATAYLLNSCMQLIGLGRLQEMGRVAHQCMIIQFIVELGVQLNEDPRRCINPFFTRIIEYESLYFSAFQTETEALKARLISRAERIALQPNCGLNPAEVFSQLPPALRRCFQSRNLQKLQRAISKLPPAEAKYHLQRCIRSGLWVPTPSKPY